MPVQIRWLTPRGSVYDRDVRKLVGMALGLLVLASSSAVGQEPEPPFGPETPKVTKTASDTAAVEDQPFIYTITVQGGEAISGLRLDDTMPPGVTILDKKVTQGSADCSASTPTRLICTNMTPPFQIELTVKWNRSNETGDSTVTVNNARVLTEDDFAGVQVFDESGPVSVEVKHKPRTVTPPPPPRKAPDCAVVSVATEPKWTRNRKNPVQLLVENHGNEADTCIITFKAGGLTFPVPAPEPGSISLGAGIRDVLVIRLKPQDVGAKGGQTFDLTSCATATRESHPTDDCLTPPTRISVGDGQGGGGKHQGGKKELKCEVSVTLVSVSLRAGDTDEHTLSISTRESQPVGVLTTTEVKVTPGKTTTVNKKVGADEVGGGKFPFKPHGTISITDGATGHTGSKPLEGTKIDGPACPGSLSRAYSLALEKEGDGPMLAIVVYRWDAVLVD